MLEGHPKRKTKYAYADLLLNLTNDFHLIVNMQHRMNIPEQRKHSKRN